MWDLAVVGAGPAGATAALAARRARPDARVLLLDKSAFPRDKACGDGIPAHAVATLASLGVPDVVAGYPPIPQLRLETPGGVTLVAAPRRPNWVVPRTVFDARLVEAATAAGATLRRRRVRRVVDHGDRVEVDDEVARVVIAADGANSTVRRLLGAPANPDDHLAIAVRGYAPAPPVARGETAEQRIAMVEDAWPSYAWSFPIGDGRANVGYGLLRAKLRNGRGDLHDRLAALLPDQPAEPTSLRAHHLPLSSWRPAPAQGSVLLAGDAASLINPLTGEGIHYAVVSGALAGTAALVAPDAAAACYTDLLRSRLGRHLRSTDVAARLVRVRPLMDAAILAASRSRSTFDALIELGLGEGLLTAGVLARVAAAAVRRTLPGGVPDSRRSAEQRRQEGW